MKDFYKHLKLGISKDKALQQAILDYRKNIKAKEQSHPYYWAGFVIYGSMNPIDLGQKGFPSIWIFLILILVTIFYYFKIKSNE